MIDFILFCFVIGVFACGFWCGKKFGSLKSMMKAAHSTVSDWLK
jgi:hypothetical protein